MKNIFLGLLTLFSSISVAWTNEDIELCEDNYSFENSNIRVGLFYQKGSRMSVVMEESFFPKLLRVRRYGGVVSLYDVFRLGGVEYFIGAYSSSNTDVALNGFYKVRHNKRPQLILEFERGKVLTVEKEIYLVTSSDNIHEYETIVYKLIVEEQNINMNKIIEIEGKFLSGFSLSLNQVILTGIDSERRTWGVILNSNEAKFLSCKTN